jgi:hypothetical protein
LRDSAGFGSDRIAAPEIHSGKPAFSNPDM